MFSNVVFYDYFMSIIEGCHKSCHGLDKIWEPIPPRVYQILYSVKRLRKVDKNHQKSKKVFDTRYKTLETFGCCNRVIACLFFKVKKKILTKSMKPKVKLICFTNKYVESYECWLRQVIKGRIIASDLIKRTGWHESCPNLHTGYLNKFIDICHKPRSFIAFPFLVR